MSSNITKDQLALKIKQSFGYPTVNIELEESHLEFAIDRAVDLYRRSSYGDGVTSDYLLFTLSAGVSAYDIPDDVQAILHTQIGGDQLAGNVAELFTFENLMWNIGALNVWNWGNFGLVTYHMALQNLDLIRQMIPSIYSIRYNRRSNKMYVNPAPIGNVTLWMNAYTSMPASALYDSDWIYEWGKAECAEILGHIRSKYSSLPGPGGSIQLDGNTLLGQAASEKDRLRKSLLEEYSEPLDFFIA